MLLEGKDLTRQPSPPCGVEARDGNPHFSFSIPSHRAIDIK